MTTQQFTGKGQLIDRLAAQVGNREMAIQILQDRGHLKADGETFTEAGAKRNAMSAEERAKDRAAKRTDKPVSAFKYSVETNRATFKR